MRNLSEHNANCLRFLRETVTENPFIPQTPTGRQAAFLAVTVTEAFFGGAAGPGKSSALLMAALQFAHVQNYAALLLRKTFSDLNQPSALTPRSFAWLGGTKARWRGSDHSWEFPSGAILKFGYLDGPLDIYQYQSAEFQFIGFDELTQFREGDYRYMFSRLRRLKDTNVPLRMRSASNPGNMGHEWVKQRFITEGRKNGRVYVPAKMADNPYLDVDTYRQTLSNLDPVTRRQLEDGDWTARQAGSMFSREKFNIIPALPGNLERCVRYWDKAGTKDGTGARTCGVLMARCQRGWVADTVNIVRGGSTLQMGNSYIVIDVKKGRWSAAQREAIIQQTAELDRRQYGFVHTWVEQEPGSGGKESAENTIINLAGYNIQSERVTGEKSFRAGPMASQAAVGNIALLAGDWNPEYLDEIEAFPEGALKDQVDASSGAFNKLSQRQAIMVA